MLAEVFQLHERREPREKKQMLMEIEMNFKFLCQMLLRLHVILALSIVWFHEPIVSILPIEVQIAFLLLVIKILTSCLSFSLTSLFLLLVLLVIKL